ncbi:mediator of DNA damage checkpoint protein 1-like [Oryzias melastigma]|uniref:LIM zinc-binding domain-containing protein n=1 Tax=Oryzias melastigma TaxID=30732 RepID=A0A3B3C0W3_ORYME|nr:mediator of DNA damage checkpoint protein 1-like [Oryzias melastigma]
MCSACLTPVYPMEKMVANKLTLHHRCFSCKYCKKKLSIHNYSSLHGEFYCISHYKQLFKRKGNYDEAFGHIPLKDRWVNKNKVADEPDARSPFKKTKNYLNHSAEAIVAKSTARELENKSGVDAKGKLKISWPPEKKNTGVSSSQRSHVSERKPETDKKAVGRINSEQWKSEIVQNRVEMRDKQVKEQSQPQGFSSSERLPSKKPNLSSGARKLAHIQDTITARAPEKLISVINQSKDQTKVSPKPNNTPTSNRSDKSKGKKSVHFAPNIEVAQSEETHQLNSEGNIETIPHESNQVDESNNKAKIGINSHTEIEASNEKPENKNYEAKEEKPNKEKEAEVQSSQEIPQEDKVSLTGFTEEADSSLNSPNICSAQSITNQKEPPETDVSVKPNDTQRSDNVKVAQISARNQAREMDSHDKNENQQQTHNSTQDKPNSIDQKKPLPRTNSRTKLGSLPKGKSPLSKLFTSSGNDKTSKVEPKDAKKPDAKLSSGLFGKLFQSSSDTTKVSLQDKAQAKPNIASKNAQKESNVPKDEQIKKDVSKGASVEPDPGNLINKPDPPNLTGVIPSNPNPSNHPEIHPSGKDDSNLSAAHSFEPDPSNLAEAHPSKSNLPNLTEKPPSGKDKLSLAEAHLSKPDPSRINETHPSESDPSRLTEADPAEPDHPRLIEGNLPKPDPSNPTEDNLSELDSSNLTEAHSFEPDPSNIVEAHPSKTNLPNLTEIQPSGKEHSSLEEAHLSKPDLSSLTETYLFESDLSSVPETHPSRKDLSRITETHPSEPDPLRLTEVHLSKPDPSNLTEANPSELNSPNLTKAHSSGKDNSNITETLSKPDPTNLTEAKSSEKDYLNLTGGHSFEPHPFEKDQSNHTEIHPSENDPFNPTGKHPSEPDPSNLHLSHSSEHSIFDLLDEPSQRSLTEQNDNQTGKEKNSAGEESELQNSMATGIYADDPGVHLKHPPDNILINEPFNDNIFGEETSSALLSNVPNQINAENSHLKPNIQSIDQDEIKPNSQELLGLSNSSDLFDTPTLLPSSLTDTTVPGAASMKALSLFDSQVVRDPPAVNDSAPFKQDDSLDPFQSLNPMTDQSAGFDLFTQNDLFSLPIVNAHNQPEASTSLFPDDIFGVSDSSRSVDAFPLLLSTPAPENSQGELLGSVAASPAAPSVPMDLFGDGMFTADIPPLSVAEPSAVNVDTLMMSENSTAGQQSESSWMDDLLG